MLKCVCGAELNETVKYCSECGKKAPKPVPVPQVAEVAQIIRAKDELPETLTAQIISDYLKISRSRIYEMFQIPPHMGGIPNFEIGNSKRVDKQDFLNWIEARKQDKSKKLGAVG